MQAVVRVAAIAGIDRQQRLEQAAVVERGERFIERIPFALAVGEPAPEPVLPIEQVQNVDAAARFDAAGKQVSGTFGSYTSTLDARRGVLGAKFYF